ncbi:Dynamin, GTPase domain and P-loop containing nucleoside triphosphate hydrolase domain-containing protein [Strongyloides ratti]|uniref:Dynamin, GTPase domain and P-loop containing nucleoside triphosphate hydrolase domain-containing protein n=1 Tax=Strongyloides ratti TaxID=34506 RepID=A0A090MWV7_STRRB|nr:Dynamin, GTPase domain and P-loop containing nucleoside triphosphate hydrolase domain-containing protein [Strongyloides ratti]CEF64354.1 Dynamin, GTPase domain and P-loop containing nucleoside triphosphate hydrolase domain-containing protein [Strongyloides ratti]
MCGNNNKISESAASKRGKSVSKCLNKKVSISKPESVSIKRKISSIKQEVVDININPKVIGALKSVPIFYQKCIHPLEKFYPINSVTGTLPWTDTEITGKPTIIVVGSSGTGKTSLVNFLLDSDYKGSSNKDGTNKITIIQFGSENAEVLNKSIYKTNSNFQFKQLDLFESDIKENVEEKVTTVNSTSNCLKYINLIDTPGYRANELNLHTNEKFDEIYKYLFQRVEGIIVTFDHERLNDSIKKLLKLLSIHLHKTIFILNKSEEVKKTDELIKAREKLLWFISNECKNKKPPQLFFGSYKNTPIKLNSFNELFLKDMDEINENIKKIYSQYIVTRLHCIEDHCITVYAYSIFFTTFYKVIKKHYSTDTCTAVYQIENGIKLALQSLPKCNIVEKKITEFDIYLENKSKILNRQLKSCDNYILDELREFLNTSFKNILKAGKDESKKLKKTSDFVLPRRKIIDNKSQEKNSTKTKTKIITIHCSKDNKKDNEIIKKLEAEKNALEMEKKKREEEIKIRNELEAKQKNEKNLKDKIEAELRLKLELEMQQKNEIEKIKKAEEEKRLADQEKIRKLEEEKHLRNLKDQKEESKEKHSKPVIVVVKGNDNKNNTSKSRSQKSNTSRSEKSGKSDKGFNITLV